MGLGVRSLYTIVGREASFTSHCRQLGEFVALDWHNLVDSVTFEGNAVAGDLETQHGPELIMIPYSLHIPPDFLRRFDPHSTRERKGKHIAQISDSTRHTQNSLPPSTNSPHTAANPSYL